MNKKLELVHWRDANFQTDPDKEEWTGDYINATVGWVVEDGEWLVIVGEITPGGERAVTRVPMVNVTQRQRLKVGKNLESTLTT